MKIVFLGDSLTWGGYGGDYVGEVRKRVGDRHEIINAGVGGNTIINLARRLEHDVLSHEPDAVYVMVGGNDAISYSQPGSRTYFQQAMKIPGGVVSPDDFASTYRDLLTELQLNHIHPYVGLEPAERNPAVTAALFEFNGRAREVALGLGVPVLDLLAHFCPNHTTVPDRDAITYDFIREVGVRGRDGWDDFDREQAKFGYTYTFDGVHLTPAAAVTMAEQIIAFMAL